ncbi:MAG: malate dehydrogenase [Spirochaetae bacterium HGW-Spirochaetae-4]|nr:MAG: malate dehydrogenase [Spirochaetae bacterium HGW-Spirochaetae-8]PKL19952.1 MAG: malate dehydrogenase [Spirochaetae bacterium HGW-Spirochaetae-4]
MSGVSTKAGFLCDPVRIRNYCTAIFVAHGVPDYDAHVVADSLVTANLRGLDSHGITRVGIYADRLKKKLVNSVAHPKVVKDKNAMLLIDGDNGMGAVVTLQALRMGISRAKEYGICSIGITHSNHYGAGAYYIKEAVKANLACHLYGHAPPTMAPWGGIKPYLGTNPYSFGIPAGKYPPIILDMASSVVARGRILLAAKENKSIPEGWAIDTEGRPTMDAQAALAGSVLPFAGPKGYGIALMNDILAGVLTSSNFGSQIPDLYRNLVDVQNIGAFIQLTDIESFIPVSDFNARMEKLVEDLKSITPAQGVDQIYLPGEIENNKEAVRSENGFSIAEVEVEMLSKLGKPMGLDVEEIFLRGGK